MSGAVRAVWNRRDVGEHAMWHFAGAQIHDVEPDVLTQADVGVTIAAVDGERKDAAFADAADVAHKRIVAGAVDPKVRLGAEISEFAVQAGDAVVRLQTRWQALEDVTAFGVDHQEAAVRSAIPPTGRDVKFLAVGCDRSAVAACFVKTFPENLLGLQVESAEASAGGGIVNGVAFGVAAKAAQAFLEDRNINPADEAVPVVNVEDKDAVA